MQNLESKCTAHLQEISWMERRHQFPLAIAVRDYDALIEHAEKLKRATVNNISRTHEASRGDSLLTLQPAQNANSIQVQEEGARDMAKIR